MRAFLAPLLCMLVAFVAPAKTNYVSAAGSGAMTGADTNNCQTLGWADGSGNWGSGGSQINSGDTICIVGICTNRFIANGNNFNLTFIPGSGFIAPAFGANLNIIDLGGYSNIVVTGGIVACTSNGTDVADGGSMPFSVPNQNALNSTGNFVTVTGLTVSNMYNRQAITDDLWGASGDGGGIEVSGSFVVVSNCTIQGVQDGIYYTFGDALFTNVTIVNNVISNYNHGVIIGCGTRPAVNPLLYTVMVSNNIFLSGDMYQSPVNSSAASHLHRNALFVFDESTNTAGQVVGTISNMWVCYNYIWHGYQPAANCTAGSGGTFFDSGYFDHIRIFNNIGGVSGNISWTGGGGFFGCGGADVLIANNTAIGVYSGGTWYGGNMGIGGTGVLFNNLCFNGNGILMTGSYGGTNTDTLTLINAFTAFSDFNDFPGDGSFLMHLYNSSGGQTTFDGGPGFSTLANWQTYYGNEDGWPPPTWSSIHADPHSITGVPALNAQFMPGSNDVVLTGHATNLTSYGITDDFYHHPRPSTGTTNWTIGAVVYYASTPSAPTSVSGRMSLTGCYILQ